MKTQVACTLVIGTLWATGVAAQPGMAPPGQVGPGAYLPAPADVEHAASLITATAPDSSRGAPLVDSPCFSGKQTYVDPGADCWVSADYLLWWLKDAHTPPLVTSGTAASAGILGRDGTTTLFGGRQVDLEDHQGLRVTAGVMVDDEHLVGVEGNYFFLAQRGANFTAGSVGDPVLARPFFNANTNAQDSELVAQVGIVRGTVQAKLDSRLQNGEVNFLCVMDDDCNRRLILLMGSRYVQLDEGLRVAEDLFLPGEAILTGGQEIRLADSFTAHNNFYGGQLGGRGEWWHGPAFVQLEGKAAIGLCHESVSINGATQLIPVSGTASTQAGGLLTLPSNIGRYHRDEFAVLPEASVKLGYHLTDNLAVTIGYSFLYLSDVARPGNQIDFTINPAQLPTSGGAGLAVGPNRPLERVHGTDFWAQGVQMGVEMRY